MLCYVIFYYISLYYIMLYFIILIYIILYYIILYYIILYYIKHNPSGRTMALGSTQPLTEMSTRCISWG